MIKTDITGVYAYVVPNDEKKRDTYKFILRQTVTVAGIGKKTVKETFTVKGMTYKKALAQAGEEIPAMRERATKKIKGLADNPDDNKLNTITLDELWEEFIEHKQLSTSPWAEQSLRTNKSTYKNHVSPVIGRKYAMQVTYIDVESCLLKIRKVKMSARMEQGVIAVLRPMFLWWFKRNDLMDKKTNPAQHQDVATPAPRQITLSWEDMEKLFTAMYNYDNPKFREVFIWLSTGRRVNEVLSLRYEDISTPYYTLRAENNKVRKPMMYKVPLELEDDLNKESGWVHTSPRNRDKKLTDVTVDKHWNILRAGIGLPKFNKHDIRHLIETVLTDSECPQQTIDMVLGHLQAGASKHYKDDTTQTADRKARAVQFFLDKVFNKIDRDKLYV